MARPSWRVASACEIGTSHAGSGTPCQDSATHVIIRTKEGPILVAVVCDGEPIFKLFECCATLTPLVSEGNVFHVSPKEITPSTGRSAPSRSCFAKMTSHPLRNASRSALIVSASAESGQPWLNTMGCPLPQSL
jgi:hypothetical protein